MFAGHLGAGLMLKPACQKAGLGALFFAAMLLDFLLWILVLFGVESVVVPAGFRKMADLGFEFPYSHSLLAATAWSLGAFAGCWLMRRISPNRLRFSVVVAIAVFSHFVLDWLVHVPELPLAGQNSAKLGLGLWRTLPLAWTVETFLVAMGLWFYLRTVRLTRGRQAALIVVTLLVMLLTVTGQASTSPPPKPAVMAASSLATIALLAAFGWWLERRWLAEEASASSPKTPDFARKSALTQVAATAKGRVPRVPD